jgi:hypothetical protein
MLWQNFHSVIRAENAAEPGVGAPVLKGGTLSNSNHDEIHL